MLRRGTSANYKLNQTHVVSVGQHNNTQHFIADVAAKTQKMKKIQSNYYHTHKRGATQRILGPDLGAQFCIAPTSMQNFVQRENRDAKLRIVVMRDQMIDISDVKRHDHI